MALDPVQQNSEHLQWVDPSSSVGSLAQCLTALWELHLLELVSTVLQLVFYAASVHLQEELGYFISRHFYEVIDNSNKIFPSYTLKTVEPQAFLYIIWYGLPVVWWISNEPAPCISLFCCSGETKYIQIWSSYKCWIERKNDFPLPFANKNQSAMLCHKAHCWFTPTLLCMGTPGLVLQVCCPAFCL